MYYFDDYGWLSNEPIQGRETSVVPPSPEQIPEGYAANFTGYDWVIVPYVEPPPPDPEAPFENMGMQIKNFMDLKVRERKYEDMKSACTYALSGIPRYKADGDACVSWRDAVWTQLDQTKEDVIAGLRPFPTLEELIAELPVLEWPS